MRFGIYIALLGLKSIGCNLTLKLSEFFAEGFRLRIWVEGSGVLCEAAGVGSGTFPENPIPLY